MKQEEDFLLGLLEPCNLTTIVDIGANPIDGDPPYKLMLEKGLCEVIGFEPQEEALRKLLERKGPLETYLPYAIGDGQQHTLYQCRASGMTSLYKPDLRYLRAFTQFETWGSVESLHSISTQRLDDVVELADLDMIKIDIQGGELDVFKSGREKLSGAVVIQTEVSFMPLYENQPVFWEIDKELRYQGFVPHTFDALKAWPISPYSHPENARASFRQLLEADIVYVRDFINHEAMSDEQVRQLALIAHHCYGSHDLVTRCLSILEARDVLTAEAQAAYRSHIFPGFHSVGNGGR